MKNNKISRDVKHGGGLFFQQLDFFYISSIVASILMYIFFVPEADCQLNVAFITMNIVFCIVLSIISFLPKVQEFNPKSGILQSSIITAYCTYLVWSSMMSEPTGQCNIFLNSGSANQVVIFIGAAFTIVAVLYSTLRAANSKSFDSPETQPLTTATTEEDEGTEKKVVASSEEKEDPNEELSYSPMLFHLFFFLGSLYLCMLLSDWATVDSNGTKHVAVDTGMGSVWVKMISSWIAILLYLWTLLAPVMFPDRDFGYQKENGYWGL